MRRFAITFGTLALAACNFHFSSDEIAVENAIRENLTSRGEVLEVDMTQNEDRMTGFARVRNRQGSETRLDCTAERTQGASTFNWRCVQPVDEALIQETETAIRNSLQAQATVQDVQLTRRDNDHMTGFAQVRDSNGTEGRMNCTADRQQDGTFNWRCDPPSASADAGGGGGEQPVASGGGEQAAPADAGGGKDAPAGDAGGSKPTQ